MDALFSFLQEHWLDIINVATAIVTAFSIVAKLTTNVWDDGLAAKLLRLLSLAPKAPK